MSNRRLNTGRSTCSTCRDPCSKPRLDAVSQREAINPPLPLHARAGRLRSGIVQRRGVLTPSPSVTSYTFLLRLLFLCLPTPSSSTALVHITPTNFTSVRQPRHSPSHSPTCLVSPGARSFETPDQTAPDGTLRVRGFVYDDTYLSLSLTRLSLSASVVLLF